ncbi:maltose ABC transporter permease MalF [Rubrivivax albus]|uniref:Maltose/maltodextrin transport system permease protein n=1 Tax=Rubrivivax albus TaxID=2499835 RepID=A0A3S2TQY5_9BURK|nr:maltose ABC transporter permease MalF [Rubrivivax albus]RVT51519.1 maltose ABC transporter permease MalF [Rubrivivax albus]
MTMARRWRSTALAAACVAIILAAVVQVHAVGQTLLAVLLLVCGGLAVWAYTSPRTHALRYLLPGIGAAVVFVIFPMLYTVGIGFTNYSASNLLEFERAREVLRESSTLAPGSLRSFALEGGPDGVRVHLDGGLATPPLALRDAPLTAALTPADPPATTLSMAERVALLPALRQLTLQPPSGPPLRLASLRSFGHVQPLYEEATDGALTDRITGIAYRPDDATGFYTSADGDRLQPGYRVAVGFSHYATVFSEGRFREPFLGVLVWTVVFSAATVVIAGALGLLLAVLLNWEALPFRGAYRLVLFLPYAVPGFISILVFKGLFNQNLGEINFILDGLFGIRPAWLSDPTLARTMLLIVNVWLGFPYIMVLCSGLIKSIPADLYEASAVSGAGPWVNFSRITAPLIVKPLTPLLIAAFAFNFNNFVLVSLLTGGRPDRLDTTLPAGTTDILVSYTWRIAFQDSGQQFGLAAAISTVIFLIVAAITLLQMRFTRVADEAARR